MITRRNALWLFPFLLLVTFPLWKVPVGSFLAPPGGYDPEFAQRKPTSHNFTMTGITILQTENGKQTANIRASKARTSPRPDEYILDEMEAEIIDDDDTQTDLIADSGNYNAVRQQLHLKGNVVITNISEKYSMKTEVLYYDGLKGMIFCPGTTFLSGDGITITGSSFRHDMKKGMYTVGGRVKSTIKGYEGG